MKYQDDKNHVVVEMRLTITLAAEVGKMETSQLTVNVRV